MLNERVKSGLFIWYKRSVKEISCKLLVIDKILAAIDFIYMAENKKSLNFC